ncbi:MAG: helix-turn-helix transcriptional regulator [Candidatus Velamenicoccus archaeovorus]
METGTPSRGPGDERRELLAHRALGDQRRADILDALRTDGPLDARELADRVGLHHNTVRSHLRTLEEAALVRRSPERRDRPGRPRIVYRASPAPADRYEVLSKVLAAFVAETVPDAAAGMDAVGRSWGRRLAAEGSAGDEPVATRARGVAPGSSALDRPGAAAGGSATDDGVEAHVERLVALLEDLGFAPELVDGAADGGTQSRRGHRRILLHACPFVEVAKDAPEVACSVHLGIMRGALAELGGLVEATGLEPFVRPDLCVAHLATTGPRNPCDGRPDERSGERP